VFAARRYATDDRFVLEVTDGPLAARRYVVEGGPSGATCAAGRVDPDLSLTQASLGALLYGGVRPSALAAGRRLEARTPEVLRRADLFFPWHVAPHCQTNY
jgi:predicted acetyltransferase